MALYIVSSSNFKNESKYFVSISESKEKNNESFNNQQLEK